MEERIKFQQPYNEYYDKKVHSYMTQCMEDLYSGKIQINDVPYERRSNEEYLEAHKYARTIENDMERHDRYWKIASQLEKDMIQSRKDGNVVKERILISVYDYLFYHKTEFFT